MQLWVVEGDNNERYEDRRNWFVGLSKDIPGVIKLVKEDISVALYEEGEADNCEAETETPIENPHQPGYYYWNWFIWFNKGEEDIEYKHTITLFIYSYTLED